MSSTILVADDDELLLALLTHRLSAKGYQVRAAQNGQDALDLARAERPDAIVLDAMMPVMDGFAALQELKADPALSRIPVIMLTALKGESDVVAALDAGAADYLVKPFMAEELVSRLGRLLRTERSA
jgi:DNA-binding response OmpR family regulator